MSFSPDDFHTLVRMIEDHPEWRADLRRLLLTNELLLLPEQMAQFRAQTDLQFQELRAALGRLTEHVQKLTEAQQRTDSVLFLPLWHSFSRYATNSCRSSQWSR